MTEPRDSFSDSAPRLDDTNGRGSLRRLSFLAADGAEPSWEDASSGGPCHRVLGFLLATAHAHLVAERGIDDLVAGAFARALRDPGVVSFAQLLLSMIDARKVRATDVLGLVIPPESPRAQALTEELRDLLRALRLDAEGRLDRPGTASAAPSSLPLFARFARENAEGELIVGTAASGPLSLSAAARGSALRPDEPAAFLLRRDGSRLPMHPFVLVDPLNGSPSLLWDFEDGRVRFMPADGHAPPAPASGVQPELLADLLLRMGAFAELRDFLRSLPASERDGLPPALLLAAAACHQGSLALRQRELDLAVEELEKGSRARPDLLLPHLLLAQALMAQKNVDRALDVLKKHAVLFNRSDRLVELMGDAHRQRRDPASALRMYEKAAAGNPLNAQVERKRDLLRDQLRREREERVASQQQQQAAAAPTAPAAAGLKLDDFLVDMTLEAELESYTGTVSREQELRQVVEILSCRDKRNVLLVGDPGVGKTAIVEDFVLRLAQGRLPAAFGGKKVWLMSIGTLLAGAKYRGQFEERVLEVVRLLKSEDALVFVDNIHQLVNSGLTRGGALDASSLLKPYLVRGELQVIGATTHDEFRQGFEKDASLLRCFQVVQVEEPSVDEATAMVAHVKRRYERHHRVALPMGLVRATLPVIDAVLRDRALPDKALDVYDRACAVAAMRRAPGDAQPGVALEREDVLGVLSEMSRVPVARLSEDARDTMARIEERMARRVIGQPQALSRVARTLRAARLGMSLDARRPRGVFLFVGPSGVGKTELARAMAEQLFGSVDRLVRIDMSEYRERINQSRLIGTAPGYVGYNDQNQLTDEVRKNPHSLVLLDEIEKADHDMMHLFLQVFDAGRLTDGKGRTVHFDHATIVMTSNVGTHLFQRASVGFEEGRGSRAHVLESDVLREVRRHFAPEFLNRVDEIICFRSLAHEDVRAIARQKAEIVVERLRSQGKRLEIGSDALDLVARESWSADEGARHLERTLRRLLLEPLAARALEPGWDEASGVRVGVAGGALAFEVVRDAAAEPVIEEPLDGERSAET